MKDFRRSAAPKKSRSIIFRLTEAEHALLSEEASKIGLTANELARSFARTPKGRISVKMHAQSDPAFIAELKRIGNNLNQLAKHANLYGDLPPQLEATCQEVRAIIVEAAEGQSQ